MPGSADHIPKPNDQEWTERKHRYAPMIPGVPALSPQGNAGKRSFHVGLKKNGKNIIIFDDFLEILLISAKAGVQTESEGDQLLRLVH